MMKGEFSAMDNLVLIQARMGSSRLPNKVMADICGKPDLQWVIERVQRSRLADEVMVVTSIGKENLPLIKLCAELGTRVFAGSEDDVLDRHYQAARLLQPKNVVRVTADCPVYDWRFLDQCIEIFDKDYIWIGEGGFPDGLDIEIMRFDALKKSWEEAGLASEREHVTLYMRSHPEMFRIQTFDFPIKGLGHHRWTLDEEKDYELLKAVYKHFISAGREDFLTEDIAGFLDAHPEIAAVNSGIGRNEGLAKSIANDRMLNNEGAVQDGKRTGTV